MGLANKYERNPEYYRELEEKSKDLAPDPYLLTNEELVVAYLGLRQLAGYFRQQVVESIDVGLHVCVLRAGETGVPQ